MASTQLNSNFFGQILKPIDSCWDCVLVMLQIRRDMTCLWCGVLMWLGHECKSEDIATELNRAAIRYRKQKLGEQSNFD